MNRLLLAVLLSGAAAPAFCAPAAPAALKPLPGEPVELKSVDGWSLKANFAPSQPGKMTLVLLHGTGQRKEDWRRLFGPLQRAGYGVLALDLRGHGDSRTAPDGEVLNYKKLKATKAQNDFVDMSRDAEAAVAWLAGQGVPEDSIGFIGAEVGGSIAVRYAATHPQVPLVVILSPGMAWQEVLTVNALRALKRPKPTPVLMVYSEADKRSSKEAPILHAFAKGAVGERYATVLVVLHERGTRMLRRQRALIGQIIDWLANPVKPEVDPNAVSPDGPTGSTGPVRDMFRETDPNKSPLIDDTGTPPPAVEPAEEDGDE